MRICCSIAAHYGSITVCFNCILIVFELYLHFDLFLHFIFILLVLYLHCVCLRWSCHYRQSKPMGFPPTRSRFTHCTDTDLLDYFLLIFCTSLSVSFFGNPVFLCLGSETKGTTKVYMCHNWLMWKICHGVVICSENNMK